jgi:hypothetical protein
MQGTLFTCEPVPVNEDRFVDFWANLYRYDLEYLYETNISIKPFTDDAIRNLFRWKNGIELSGLKKESVEKNYISRKDSDSVEQAIQFSQEASIEEASDLARKFLSDFPNGGAIWRIFWLHCCNQRFPIYDQHVHRAMVFVEEGRFEELDTFSEEEVVEFYLTRYLRFSSRFSAEQRKTDKAVVTFGSFLKAWPGIASSVLHP